MPNLAEDVKAAIKNVPIQDAETVKRYEEGIRIFNELVQKGLLKPRGYQLEGIDDNIKSCSFNQRLFSNTIKK